MRPTVPVPARKDLLRRGRGLEWLTIGWNLVEGAIAVAAATSAGSVALLGFGIDSFVESASGSVVLWRLLMEHRGADAEQLEHIERRAQKLVAASLFGLAAYIGLDAASRFIGREEPKPSTVGMIITALSIGVMWWLARAKRETARALGSRVMEADAFQTSACFWLSVIVLSGIALNALVGWWWSDPLAALAMTYFLVREGREIWRGDPCC